MSALEMFLLGMIPGYIIFQVIWVFWLREKSEKHIMKGIEKKKRIAQEQEG